MERAAASSGEQHAHNVLLIMHSTEKLSAHNIVERLMSLLADRHHGESDSMKG